MTRHRRNDAIYNLLDPSEMYQWQGFYFILRPRIEPEDWDMLAFRANHTQDSALKDKLFKWLDKNPRPRPEKEGGRGNVLETETN